MSTRHSMIIALVFAGGCQTRETRPPDAQTGEELTLEVASKDALRGTFRHGATTVRFDLYQHDKIQRVAIASSTGMALVDQMQVGDMLSISVFGGAASSYTDLAVVRQSAQLAQEMENDPDAARRGLAAEGALALVGDQNEFVRFEETPEAVTVAWLSRALGTRGYNGRDYPITLRLHLLASSLASRLELDIPNDGGEVAARVAPDEGACVDLREDPYGNNSYGMCGPGSSCWEWTCGDCCCHDGCKSHDWTCRNCHWYTPWNCILCGTFSSMIAGGCGTSCQETTYAQPCTIGPYDQCNGYCTCTGTYDGSTEEGAAPVQWGCGRIIECDPAIDGGCDPNLYCIPLPY